MQALKEAFGKEVTTPYDEEAEDDRVLLLGAISMCLGFAHSFEPEVERFKHYVSAMDRVINPHRHEKKASDSGTGSS